MKARITDMGMENEYDVAERVQKQLDRDREKFDEGYRVGYREGYNKAKDERKLRKEEKGDLISREALKKALDWVIDNPYVDLDREIMEEIDNAPTVTPEKILIANVTFDEDKLKEIVHTEVIDKIKRGELVLKDENLQGKWIKIGEIGLAYKCNRCGEVAVVPTNFCPNCGAKMEEVRNEIS